MCCAFKGREQQRMRKATHSSCSHCFSVFRTHIFNTLLLFLIKWHDMIHDRYYSFNSIAVTWTPAQVKLSHQFFNKQIQFWGLFHKAGSTNSEPNHDLWVDWAWAGKLWVFSFSLVRVTIFCFLCFFFF